MKLILATLACTTAGLIYAQQTTPAATNRPSIRLGTRPSTLLRASGGATTNRFTQGKWLRFESNQNIPDPTNSLSLTNATGTNLPPGAVDGTNAPPAAPAPAPPRY